MKTAKLIRSTVSITGFDLVVDGQIQGDVVYNQYHFAATGLRADRTRFDKAAELGIEKVSFEEYTVTDLNKFLQWAAQPSEIVGGKLYGFEDGAQ